MKNAGSNRKTARMLPNNISLKVGKLIFIFLFTALFVTFPNENWNRFRGINGEGRSKKSSSCNLDQRGIIPGIKLPGVGIAHLYLGLKLFTTSASTSGATQYVSLLIARQVRFFGKKNSIPSLIHTINLTVMHPLHLRLTKTLFLFLGRLKTLMTSSVWIIVGN